MEHKLSFLVYVFLFLCIIMLMSSCGQIDNVQNGNADQSNLYPQPRPSNEEIQADQDRSLEQDNQQPSHTSNPIEHTTPVHVKGIYITGWIAGSQIKMNTLVDLIHQTELNAVVIDVKNDSGEISYDSNVSFANDLKSDERKMIPNMPALLKRLKDEKIYTIARVVAFKDPYLAEKEKKYAIQYKTGDTWKDSHGTAWVNPYIDQVRKYNMDIALEAATIGFDEIQFDYIRFPENAEKMDKEVNYNNSSQISKSQLISDFLSQAKTELHQKGVFISADVFGLTTSVSDDMGIGQDWSLISQQVDYISPMVYPSHYSPGNYGLTHPDLNPYEVVSHAMKDGKGKNEKLKLEEKHAAVIRPWFQSFTARWIQPHINYRNEQVKEQIKAAKEQGVEQYLLWNPHCQYDFN